MFYIVHYRRRSILMLFSSLLGGLRSVTMATECFIVLKLCILNIINTKAHV